MHVVRFSTLDPLQPLAGQWDRLARGVPFRGWAWLANWWRHYGAREAAGAQTSLFVVAVFDDEGVVAGIAPWYVRRSAAWGRVVRWLGSGEVCSEYLSVLCLPGLEETVSENLADWLCGLHWSQIGRTRAAEADRWDLLELTGVDAADAVVGHLAGALAARGCTVHCRPGPPCWRLELPDTWDQYLTMLSKDHRKQVRRLEQRLLATGRAVLRTVRGEPELARAEKILFDLHQRRREQLGEPGCFASARLAAFHRDVLPELLRAGQLGLHWIELDGAAVAAEYQLLGDAMVYAYQSGIDPDAREHSPGALAHVATLRDAIARGCRGFDFLRGDEPYKAHWRARPRETLELRVAPDRLVARLRHGLWRAGSGAKRWVKNRLRRANRQGANRRPKVAEQGARSTGRLKSLTD